MATWNGEHKPATQFCQVCNLTQESAIAGKKSKLRLCNIGKITLIRLSPAILTNYRPRTNLETYYCKEKTLTMGWEIWQIRNRGNPASFANFERYTWYDNRGGGESVFLTLHTFSSRLVTIFAPLIVFLMLSWQFQVRHKPGDIVFREPFKKHFTYN